MPTTNRLTATTTVALTTSSNSPEVNISEFAWGEVAVPNGSSITSLTYYIVSPEGTYYAAYDSAGSAVTQTVAADRAYPIPPAVFGSSRIQIRANAAGNVRITLKS